MKNLINFTLIIVFSLVASQSSKAQIIKTNKQAVGSWRLIGETKVSGGGVDHDIIKVEGPGDNFRKLKFKVTNSGLNMIRMVVTYDNGGREEIDIRQNISQGGESRVIDLKGGKRSIRNIQFWYEDKGILDGKARVAVFGRK
jgi:hypothetical protein